MSTTTTNYGLTKPERSDNYNVDVMGNNMDKIDAELKDHKTRITAVESEVNGALSCTSVTTSGKITSTGLITGNGGFKGTLTGNVNGFIRAKLTKTNPNNGSGAVIPAKIHLGKGGEYANLHPTLPGIIITNPDDTHSITVNCDTNTNNSDSKFYVYAKNILTGAVRTLGSYSCSSSTMNNPSYTYTIKLCEVVYGGGYLSSITSNTPAIYLTTP